MKNKPILRWILLGLIHGLMYVLGVVLFPLYFPLKRIILKHKIPFLIWFLNTDEIDYISNIYGDYGYRDKRGFDYYKSTIFRKIYEGFIWLVIRNSHYYFRLNIMFPKIGEPYDIDILFNETHPISNGMLFCSETVWGKQNARYWVKGTKYFRYSFNKPFLGRRLNLHSGWAPTRWILKLRFFNGRL